MDDPLLVRRLERAGDVPGERQGLLERDRSRRETVLERRPLDELEDERVNAVRLLEPEDRADRGVVELREDLRLAPEAREAVGVPASCSGSTFTATSRPRRESRAR